MFWARLKSVYGIILCSMFYGLGSFLTVLWGPYVALGIKHALALCKAFAYPIYYSSM